LKRQIINVKDNRLSFMVINYFKEVSKKLKFHADRLL